MFKRLPVSSVTVAFAVAFGSVVGARRASAASSPPRPPQAAFDACSQKAEGDSCQVALPDRTVSGTCAATPDGALACRPDHPPGPPPELQQACAGKSDGDACTTTHGDRSEEGICRAGRAGALTCLP